ncbi:winged helix-turn-helix domain-containing protein [Photobacterium sp. J15]|uniref:winged helix-turn-helix domain-containing protein n=1 Tax=Photobacterium sp. J15 TaxID=265901 RepID=UPI000A06F4F4|nr:winged helix-turn-helix domain-containing protein [Photobacterium sp. J15]
MSYHQLTNPLKQRARRLKSTECEILQMLIQHEGEYVSRETLLNEVWRGRVVSHENIAQSISQLRIALDDNGKEQKVIKTKPKAGYMLLPDHIEVQHTRPAPELPEATVPSSALDDKNVELTLQQKVITNLLSATVVKDWPFYALFIIASMNIFYTHDLFWNATNPPEYNTTTYQTNGVMFIIDHHTASLNLYQHIEKQLPENIHNVMISKNPDSFYVSCIFTNKKTGERNTKNLSFSVELSFDYIQEKIVEKCN